MSRGLPTLLGRYLRWTSVLVQESQYNCTPIACAKWNQALAIISLHGLPKGDDFTFLPSVAPHFKNDDFMVYCFWLVLYGCRYLCFSWSWTTWHGSTLPSCQRSPSSRWWPSWRYLTSSYIPQPMRSTSTRYSVSATALRGTCRYYRCRVDMPLLPLLVIMIASCLIALFLFQNIV